MAARQDGQPNKFYLASGQSNILHVIPPPPLVINNNLALPLPKAISNLE